MNTIMTPEQFAAANKAGIETLVTLANSAVARAERLAALNLNTTRAVLEDGVAGAKTLMAVKNPQDLNEVQAALVQPIVDKAVAYSRSVYEIVAEGQQELVKLFETQIAELNKTVAAALDQASKSAPAGTEGVFSAIKSAIAANNSAYENVSKTVKQLTETAESKLTEVTTKAVKAVSAKKAA